MGSWSDTTLDTYNGDLIALWEMDEAAGAPRDSLSGIDLTELVGAASIVYGVEGVSGRAISWLGDSYGFSDPAASLPAGDFTLAAWIKKAQAACGILVVTVGNAPGLTVLAAAIRWSDGTGVIASATGVTTTGVWHHVAVKRASGTYTIYLDGSPLSTSGSDAVSLAGGQVGIGITVEAYANATLDQIVLWDAALSDAALAALYNGGDGRRYLDAGFAVLARAQRVAGVRLAHRAHTRMIGHPSQFAPPPPEIIPDLLRTRTAPGVRIRRRPHGRRISPLMLDFGIRQARLRGRSRVFGEPQYRFYRSSSGPPAETDTPYATSASLPATPADTFADGTWYLSVSWYNGILDSGFLPVGPRGETYRLLTVSGGAEAGNPPAPPMDLRLIARPGGVVRIVALYHEAGDNRADEWAIAYTTDGGTPPAGAPDITQTFGGLGLELLQYDLPAQADGTTVKVRVEARRNDGTTESPVWVYSSSTVLTATADAAGPPAPTGGDFLSEGLAE